MALTAIVVVMFWNWVCKSLFSFYRIILAILCPFQVSVNFRISLWISPSGILTEVLLITQQWSKDSNVRARTIIPWEENAGVNLQDLGLYNDFLDMTLKVQAINLKRQIDFIKIKNFCASRISSNEERTYRMRKYLQTIYLMSSGIQNNKKLSKDLSKDFFKEDREE